MKGKVPFIIFFLYLMLSGALRKWYLPSLGTPILLGQYLLLYVVYFTAPKANKLTSFTPAFQGVLMVYVMYGALEVVNMRGTTNLLVQVYGFAMHFSFVPLIFMINRIMNDEESFNKLLKYFIYSMIAMFFLGITQYFASPGAFINRYAVDAAEGTYEVAVGSGGRARITGTFSYLATYASFLCFILHILFYASLVSLIQKKTNWIFIAAFFMGIINLFMTGSRGATVYYFLSEATVLLLLTFGGQAKFLKNLVPFMVIMVIGYFILMATQAGSSATTDFLDRLTGLGDIDSRLEDAFSPFKFADQIGPIGYGIGTAQFPVGGMLTNRWEMPAYWEEEGERIALELGIIGYFIVMALRYSIFISCYLIYKKIKTLENKILALTMTMYQLPYLINLQTNIFNYIDGTFYWLAVGLVYFAWKMDKDKQQPTDLAMPANAFRWDRIDKQ